MPKNKKKFGFDVPLENLLKLNVGGTKCKKCGKCCRTNPCKFATFDLQDEGGEKVCDNLMEWEEDSGKFICAAVHEIIMEKPLNEWINYPAFGSGCHLESNEILLKFAQGAFDRLTKDQKKMFFERNRDVVI